MTSSDKDTDPSTPRAIRPSDAPLAAAGRADAPGAEAGHADAPPAVPVVPPAPSTDPGLGSSPAAPRSSVRPRGIVVPPPTLRIPTGAPAAGAPPLGLPGSLPIGGKTDSVELLLEGMEEPKPDRTKTTPQSHGEAAAAYHAEHGLRPGGVLREVGPKVLVERGSLLAGGGGAMVTTEPVGRHPRTLARRIVAATVAGLLVVLALFGVMRATAGTSPPASAPAAAVPLPAPPPTLAPPAPVVPAVPAVLPAAGPATAEVSPVAVAAAEGEAAPSPRPTDGARTTAGVAPAPSRRPAARTTPTVPAATGGSLGEFKTHF